MIIKNTSDNALKIPHQLFFGTFSFLAANICIIVLNTDKFLIASRYTLACALCYLSCYWGYTVSKVVSAFLLFVTIILNFVDIPNLSIPIYQICIALLGSFFAVASYFYLFCRTTKKWFNAHQSNRQNARLEKRIQKSPKYTEKDFKRFTEIQKATPSSYRWGRWVILGFLILNVHAATTALSGFAIIHIAIFYIFTGIGCIGLMKNNSRLIEIYATYLVIVAFGLLVIFLLPLCVTILHHPSAILSLPKMLGGFLHGMLQKITHNKVNFASQQSISYAIGYATPYLLASILPYCIIFNKKSREWLRAKRITKGMMSAQNI